MRGETNKKKRILCIFFYLIFNSNPVNGHHQATVALFTRFSCCFSFSFSFSFRASYCWTGNAVRNDQIRRQPDGKRPIRRILHWPTESYRRDGGLQLRHYAGTRQEVRHPRSWYRRVEWNCSSNYGQSIYIYIYTSFI